MADQKLIKLVNELKDIQTDLGRIALGKLLGQGGTSIVRIGTFDGCDKEFAIKFLLVDVKQRDPDEYKRFKQAYLNVSCAQKSGCVVPMVHFGVCATGGKRIPYQVMAKMDADLKRFVVGKQPLPFECFEKVFNALSRSIETIHQLGIVHRDIKPENIFISAGKLLLGDFDIAKYDSSNNVVLAKTIKGKRLANYYFSAPEQSDGTIGKICEASDWFAFAQIMYWCMHKCTVRGLTPVSLNDSDRRFKKYDRLLATLLRQNPNDRLKNYEEIQNFLKKENEEIAFWVKHNTMINCANGFDGIVRKYVYDVGFSKECVRKLRGDLVLSALNDLAAAASTLDLVMSDGHGDFSVSKIVKGKNGVWVFGDNEMSVKSLYVYKHHSSGGHVVIVESGSLPSLLTYKKSGDYEEYGLWRGHVISRAEYDSGWAKIKGRLCSVGAESHVFGRYLKRHLFFLSPRVSPVLARENSGLFQHIGDCYGMLRRLSESWLTNELCGRVKRALEIRQWD